MTNEARKYERPVWLRRLEVFSSMKQWYLPAYKRYKSNLKYVIHHDGHFTDVQDLEGNPLKDEDLKKQTDLADDHDSPDKYFYPRVVKHTGFFKHSGQFWNRRMVFYGYPEFIQNQYQLEFQEFRKYSKRHLAWANVGHDYRMLYDAQLHHPASEMAWSGWREDLKRKAEKRTSHYLRHWDKIWPVMGRMVDFAMTMGHIMIITEPKAIGSHMMDRILDGYYITLFCTYTATIGCVCASFGHFFRWPSVFLLPCSVSIYLAYYYHWEYTKDPVSRYDYWTSWTNDPQEVQCFRHIKVRPTLVREQDVTIMVKDYQDYRDTTCKFFSSLALYYGLRGIFYRLKFRESVDDFAWEILKRNICERTGRNIYYSVGSMFHRCYYQPYTGWGDRMLHWIGIGILHYFVFGCVWRDLRRVLHEKTRTRNLINLFTLRAMMGERRYMRVVEAMYWTYRTAHPRDHLGARDRWYLSQRHRNTPGTHQFLF